MFKRRGWRFLLSHDGPHLGYALILSVELQIFGKARNKGNEDSPGLQMTA
jgi:hypothetical protein